MSTSLMPLVDVMPEISPEEMAHIFFFGFTVQRMGIFKEKEYWTVLLTADKAEFFHWLSEEKHFVIPRRQSSQFLYVSNWQQDHHFMVVQRPSGYLYFFKITRANAEILGDWLGMATAKQGPAALIRNLCNLL